MSITDWDIQSGGDVANLNYGVVLHSSIPKHELFHDTWALQIRNTGALYGRLLSLYGVSAPDFAAIDAAANTSIRGALYSGAESISSNVLGLRCSNNIDNTTTNFPFISNDGYQLLLVSRGEPAYAYVAELYRVVGGAPTLLGMTQLDDKMVTDGHWYHLRLDFLSQPDGSGILQVFQNDLTVHPINPANPPSWGANWVKILEVTELPQNVITYSRIGWGSQVAPGPHQDVYVDWVEALYS